MIALPSDLIRVRRIAAVRSLSSLPPNQIVGARSFSLDVALAEFMAAQNVSLDMPDSQLNLAVVYQNVGR